MRASKWPGTAAAAVNAAEQIPALTETSFSSPRPNRPLPGGSTTEISTHHRPGS
jgi:hypothetical protein